MSSSQIAFNLLKNLGDIALFIILVNHLLPLAIHWKKWAKHAVCGCIFGFAALLSMNMPIHLADGVMLDMRSILVALGSFYGGALAAAIGFVLTGGFRLWLGGAGAFSGVMMAATAAAIGLMYRTIHMKYGASGKFAFPTLFGLSVLGANVGWVFLLPPPSAKLLISDALVPILLLNPLAACSIMHFIQAESQRKTARLIDPESGLPNKQWLKLKVRRLIRKRIPFSFIALRLDNLSAIGAVYGHGFRRRILQEMSFRLQDERPVFVGEQEFILCLTEQELKRGIDAYADKLRLVITRPYKINHMPLCLFVDTATFKHQGEEAETFIESALQAFRQKGGMPAAVPSEAALLQRYKLQDALYHALRKDQLSLHYQPQFDLLTGELRGFEALLRWKHPVMGFIPPAEFIPIAEETGLIKPIGLWVLEQACAAHLQIIRSFPDATMSVNISAAQLSDSSFPGEVNHILQNAGLQPQSIELEITESMLISSFEFAERQLRLLETIGVLLALDDFGTGYSSLNYLKRLPLHTLKIDRSFTQDVVNPRESIIMQSIVQLAKQLDYVVVAEGLETDEQLSELKKLNCDIAQGYLLSRPLPEDQLPGFIAELLQNNNEETAPCTS